MTDHDTFKPASDPQRGAALISAILLLGLLAMLVTALSVYVTNSATSIAIERDRILRDTLTQSALEFAAGRVLTTPQGMAVKGEDKIRLQTGRAVIRWRAESARLDLNFAEPDLLTAILKHAGRNDDQANAITRLIVARRMLTSTQTVPKEFANLAGRKLGPFEHITDLLDIPGVTPPLFQDIEPFLTVYGQSAAIDPRIADRALLEIIPDLSAPMLAELAALADMDEKDAANRLTSLGELARRFDLKRHHTIRFLIETESAQGGKHHDDIVAVLYPDDERPYRILAWRQVD